ncbi:MAG: hypothetical protein WAM42_02645 [Candidatus Nitrosopolaris sp.]|jgi:hypothetical protein
MIGKIFEPATAGLAIMLAFVLVEMMQPSSAIKPYSREAFQLIL